MSLWIVSLLIIDPIFFTYLVIFDRSQALWLSTSWVLNIFLLLKFSLIYTYDTWKHWSFGVSESPGNCIPGSHLDSLTGYQYWQGVKEPQANLDLSPSLLTKSVNKPGLFACITARQTLRFATEIFFMRQPTKNTGEQISELHPQRPKTWDIYDIKKQNGLSHLERGLEVRWGHSFLCRPRFRVSELNYF